MAKLTDDQIKWTLILDAKGTQGTINTLSGDIRNLEKENRALAISMKETGAEISLMEKELKQMELSGKDTTKAYADLSRQIEYSRLNVKDLAAQIADWTSKIIENQKEVTRMTFELRTSDMTMAQLKQRAAELQSQLSVTSASANPEAYKELSEKLTEVKDAQDALGNKYTTFLSQMSSAPGILGSVGKSIQGVQVAFKALMANPYMLAIAGVILLIQGLVKVFSDSKAATLQYNAVLEFCSSIFDTLLRIVKEVVLAYISLITLDFSAFSEHVSNIAENTSGLLDNAQAAYEGVYAQKALEEELARSGDIMAINTARVSELRQITRDSTKSVEERLAASKEMMELEKENYAIQVKNAVDSYDVFKKQNGSLITAMKQGSREQFAEVEKYMRMVQNGTELTFDQRKQLSNLVNEITSNLDTGTDEQRKQFSSFFQDLTSAQKGFYDKSREDAKYHNQIKKEAAQKAFDDRISQMGRNLSSEELVLKQQRADGIITESEYSAKLLEAKQRELIAKINFYKQYGKDTISFEKELLENRLSIKKLASDTELLQIDEDAKREALIIGQMYVDRNYTEEEFNAKLEELSRTSAQKKLDIIRKHGISSTSVEKAVQDERIKYRKKVDKETEKSQQDEIKAILNQYKAKDKLFKEAEQEEKYQLSQRFKIGEISKVEYENRMLEIQKMYADQRVGLSLTTTAEIAEKVKEGYAGAEEVQATMEGVFFDLDKQSIIAADNLTNNFKTALQGLSEAFSSLDLGPSMENILGTFENTFTAINVLMEDDNASWDKKAAAITAVMSSALNTVQQYATMYFEQETSALETEKSKQLSIAGDNAEERERIEYEFAEKELALKKKQANVDAGIQIAQAFVSLATGIVGIWATCLGQFGVFGPIIAGVLTGVMAGTTVAQVAMINNQRQNVMNTTLDTPSGGGGGTPSVPTNERVVALPEGYADGGYTGSGGKYDVAGYLPNGQPYHKGEYFVAQEEMHNPMVIPLVRAIEGVRRQRTYNNPLPSGFGDGYADGGYTLPNSPTDEALSEAIYLLMIAVESLQNTTLKAEVNYFEFEKASEQVEILRNIHKKR